MQKTIATPIPKIAKSDLIKVIISVAIIDAPPKNKVPLSLFDFKSSLILAINSAR